MNDFEFKERYRDVFSQLALLREALRAAPAVQTREELVALARLLGVPTKTLSDWFERKAAILPNILEVLSVLPDGKVTTYASIAVALGNPKAAQQVGRQLTDASGIPELGARILPKRWWRSRLHAFVVPESDPTFRAVDRETGLPYPAHDERSNRWYWLKKNGVPYAIEHGELKISGTFFSDLTHGSHP